MSDGGIWQLVSLIAGAAAVFLIGYLILDAIFGRTPMQRRIATLRKFRVGPQPVAEHPLVAIRAAGGRAVESVDLLTRFAARSEKLLDQAASRATPPEWLAVRMAGTAGVVLVLLVLLPAWLAVLLGLLVGFVGSTMLLRVRISRRERRFADELPGALQLVLSSLRSGFTLNQSIEASVRDDEGPVAEELRRALSESRINGEFEDALARVGERVHSQEMVWLVMAIRLQREVGGSLAEVMQTTADTMRERAYLRRHVRSLSAEGRFSAWILVALPIGTAVMLYIARPEYVTPLFTDPIGIVMLAAAAVLMVIGGLWLKAAIKVEV